MTTKTTSKSLVPVSGQIAAFEAFQVRIRSIEFYRDESLRQQANGEEILAELARLPATGDVLRDGRVRAGWEEKFDEACDAYNAALRHLGWELKRA